jgi:hypothetical protein
MVPGLMDPANCGRCCEKLKYTFSAPSVGKIVEVKLLSSCREIQQVLLSVVPLWFEAVPSIRCREYDVSIAKL